MAAPYSCTLDCARRMCACLPEACQDVLSLQLVVLPAHFTALKVKQTSVGLCAFADVLLYMGMCVIRAAPPAPPTPRLTLSRQSTAPTDFPSGTFDLLALSPRPQQERSNFGRNGYYRNHRPNSWKIKLGQSWSCPRAWEHPHLQAA